MGGLNDNPKGHYRLIQADYDLVRAQSTNTCLYCLSFQQVAFLLAILPPGAWKTRWFSLIGTPIEQDWLDAFISNLETELMTDHCDIDTLLTQIKNDTGHIRTVTDEIKLKTDLIEAGVEALIASGAAQDVAIAAIAADLTTLSIAVAGIAVVDAGIAAAVAGVAGTVNEISDDVDNIEIIVADPVDGVAEISADVDAIEVGVAEIQAQGAGTTIIFNTINFYSFIGNQNDTTAEQMYARYNALCAGILDWIYSEAFIIQQQLGASEAQLSAIDGLITLAINGHIPGVVFHGQTAYSISEMQTAILDGVAVDAVACYMITYLAQLPMTFESFSGALTAFSPSNFNETVLRDVLAAALVYNDAFAAFVSNMQAEFEVALAANPTDFICAPCAPSGFCSVPYLWDLTALQTVPWTIHRGILVQGDGVTGEQIPGDLNFGADIRIVFPTPCTAILTHKLGFDHAMLSPGGNAWTLEWYYDNSGVLTLYSTSNRSQTAAWPGLDLDHAIAVPTPPGGVGVAELRIYANTAFYGNATNHTSNACKIANVGWYT